MMSQVKRKQLIATNFTPRFKLVTDETDTSFVLFDLQIIFTNLMFTHFVYLFLVPLNKMSTTKLYVRWCHLSLRDSMDAFLPTVKLVPVRHLQWKVCEMMPSKLA